MKLGELLRGHANVDAAHAGVIVTGLTADSRQVHPGALFVALPKLDRAGFQFDGHDFIDAAVEAGAAAVLAQRPVGATVPVIVVADTRRALPRLAARWYGEPSRGLRITAFTGTNGKTTSTYLLEACWRAAGQRTVVVGTVETRLGEERRPAATTTPDPVTLQALWRECVDRGYEAAMMEVSSHALDQHRVDATRFEVAVFTNLTQDHLDYHTSMADYFAAKARLFEADDYGAQPTAVLNVDDGAGRELLHRGTHEPWSFGFSADAMVRATDAVYTPAGSTFTVHTPKGEWSQKLLLPGAYNVSNALGVIAAALALGLPREAIAAGLEGCRGAPGRLEPVNAGQDFGVLVDYAHTPDALAKAIGALRALTTGRLITVFGCGGDRDRAKRPEMGRIAAAGSDVAVVTSDNPRNEPPQRIIEHILAGIGDELRPRVVVEADRAAAIGLAIGLARSGDLVLIAGKGHEDYQIVGVTKHHFDDREVALAALRETLG
jgi:UDP-N-acetylmuramoyl-L-alanyl-D-glutamate--2,6-diaminopimelate ligase